MIGIAIVIGMWLSEPSYPTWLWILAFINLID